MGEEDFDKVRDAFQEEGGWDAFLINEPELCPQCGAYWQCECMVSIPSPFSYSSALNELWHKDADEIANILRSNLDQLLSDARDIHSP